MSHHHSIGKNLKSLEEVYGKLQRKCKNEDGENTTLRQELFGSDVTVSSSSTEDDESTSSSISTVDNYPATPKKMSLRKKPPVNYKEKESDHFFQNSFTNSLDEKRIHRGKGKLFGISNSQSKDNNALPFKLRNTKGGPHTISNGWSEQGRNLTWPEYWDFFLQKSSNRQQVAPVNLFKHAPFADIWKKFATIGLIIEVPNPYAKLSNQEAFWIARIKEFAGYRALIEYESFENSTKELAWIPFCSDVPQQLGFSDTSNKLLRPSPDVVKCYPNFLDAARTTLMKEGKRQSLITLQDNHSKLVAKKIEALQIYKLGTKLDVIDVNSLERNQIATVTGIIGDRIHVTYGVPKKTAEYDLGHFVNVKSEYVNCLGWSDLIGQDLYANEEDIELTVSVISSSKQLTASTKTKNLPLLSSQDFLEVGMAIEVRHPKFPFEIAPAVISKVLKFGYFIAQIDTTKVKNACKMCFHFTSPYIFQCGFAHSNEIDFIETEVESSSVSLTWETYYKQSHHVALDSSLLLNRSRSPHFFEEGMKMEAVDLCTPNTIRPATVVKVAGHLMRLHFDGQPKYLRDSYQWVDVESKDIYPLGWAEMVGHNFTGYPEAAAMEIEPPGPKIISVRTIDSYPIKLYSESEVRPIRDEELLEGIVLSEILDYEMDNQEHQHPLDLTRKLRLIKTGGILDN